ncbi:hypothetical protein SAMN04487764_1112 [Gillisia sp. Hel1_33_143]|nr:hypothetical protein SAMN04487764_1112 [Gillisia sp. Hel1_33_143]
MPIKSLRFGIYIIIMPMLDLTFILFLSLKNKSERLNVLKIGNH